MKPRGIQEVPSVLDGGIQHRDFLQNIREQVLQLRARLTVPDPPTNLRATAQAFANLIQFTRSSDADYYEVLVAVTPNLKGAGVTIYDIGDSQTWVDNVNQVGITHFYWVRARKLAGATSIEVGPVSATTLGSAAGVTPPAPPPPGNLIVIDQVTGRQYAYTLAGPRSLT